MNEGGIEEGVAAELRGRYELVAKVGGVAGAETFEAIRPSDGVRVALKRLVISQSRDWKTVELFEREGRVLASLQHPAIPKFHESFVESSGGTTTFYLVNDFAPGRSLRGWMESGWHPDQGEIVRIAEFLLDVLVYLHGLNPPVIHRDIKPDNIIRADDGRLWLVDFGAVRDFTASIGGGSTVVGTYGYMAPEQFRGHTVPATDLYGVGATVLHLLCGRPPVDLPQEKLKVVFRPHVNASEALLAWLDRALEPAPEDRFPSATSALVALRTGPPATAARKRPVARLGFIAAALAVGLLIAGGVGIVEVLRLRSKTAVAAAARVARPISPLLRRSVSAYKPFIEEGKLDGHMNFVLRLAASPDDKTLVSTSDGSAKIWSLATGEVLHTLGGHDGKVNGLALTTDGQIITGGGSTIKIWNGAKGTLTRSIEHPRTGAVMGVSVSPDGKTIYSGSSDGLVKSWDAATGRELQSLNHGASIYSVALAPNGITLATGATNGTIAIWDLRLGRRVTTLTTGSKATISCLAFAPDGAILASASDDHKVLMWSVQRALDFEPYHSFEHEDEVWGVTFSPDGRTLVSTGKDGTITIVDALNKTVLATMNANGYAGHSAFTSDGRRFLMAAGTSVARYRVMRRGLGTVLPQFIETTAKPAPSGTPEQALYREAMTAITTWRFDDAEAKLGEITKLVPSSQLAAIGRARLTLKRGAKGGGHGFDRDAVAKAQSQLDQAATLGKKGVEWWSTRASIARAAGDAPGTREAIRETYHLVPNEPFTSLIEATLDLDEGRSGESIAIMGRVVTSAPQPELRTLGYDLLASAYEKVGDLDAAEAAYRKRIELGPNDAAAHASFSTLLLTRSGNIDEAVAESDRARALSDSMGRGASASARTAKGTTLLWDSGDAAGAERQFDAAILASPTYVTPYYGRAALFRMRAMKEHNPKLVENARADLRMAIKLLPDYEPYKADLAELDAVERLARQK